MGSIEWKRTLFPNKNESEVTTNKTTTSLEEPSQERFLFHKSKMD